VKYFFLIMLLAFPVGASEIDARPIEIDGLPFVAFDRASAQRLLEMRLNMPILQLKLDKLSELITGLNHENDLLSDNLDLANAKNAVMLEENVELKDVINSLDSWWRNPWLWFGVGLVVGTATTVIVVYLVK